MDLQRDQAGVIARRQAVGAGLTDNDIRRRLRRREWVVVHPGVYVDHTGPLTWLQRAWAGVLYAWPASLCGLSAMRAVEGPGRSRHEATIEVAIDIGRRVADRPGLRVHRMAHVVERSLWNLGPPRLRFVDAVVVGALAAPTDLGAVGVVADACGGRRTTAVRLIRSLDVRERSPRRRFLRGVLADVAEGACSVLEHAYLVRVERAHCLPRAQRQQRADATLGVIYRDVPTTTCTWSSTAGCTTTTSSSGTATSTATWMQRWSSGPPCGSDTGRSSTDRAERPAASRCCCGREAGWAFPRPAAPSAN